MATYTGAVGTDMDMAYSMPTMMVGAVVDEPGMVTLWAGNDPLTMAPQVGDTITGACGGPGRQRHRRVCGSGPGQ